MLLLDETLYEYCIACSGYGYTETAGTDLVIHCTPCPDCEDGMVSHECD